MWKKYLGNEGGYALVIAVLAITMITILGLSVLATTTHSKNSVVKEDNNQTAYYIAEAGLNLKKADLQEIEKIYDEFQKEILAEQQNAINANKDVPKMTSAQFIAAFKARVATKLNTVTAKTYYASSDSQCTGKTNCTKVLERTNSMATVTTEAVITDTNFTYKINSVGSVNQQTRKIATTLSYALDAKAYKEKVVADSFSKYAIHSTGTDPLTSLKLISGSIIGKLGFKASFTPSKTFPFNTNNGASYTGGIVETKYQPCLDWESATKCKDSKFKDANAAISNEEIVLNDAKTPALPTFPADNEFISNNGYSWTGIRPETNILELKETSATLNGSYYLDSSTDTNKAYTLNIGSNTVNLYFKNGFSLKNADWDIKGSGTLNIYTKDFTLEKTMNFNNNNVNIISTTNFTMQNTAKILTTKDLTIKAKELSIGRENASISAGTNGLLKMYVSDSVNLSTSDNKVTSKEWNIYYKGNSSIQFDNSFKNKLNIESLYAGFSINAGYIIGDFTFHGKENSACNIECQKIYINHSSDSKAPIYINAPNSDLYIRQGNISGSFVGKNVTVYDQAIINFVPKTTTNSTNSTTSSEMEEITDGSAGKITSSFTNKSSGGSIEVD